jgi:tetratricopeptide (TPR) repeat protein
LLQAADQAKSADDKVGVYRNLVTRYESLGTKEEAAAAQMEVARYAARCSVVVKHSTLDPSKEAFLAAVKYERLGEKEKTMAAYRLAMEIDPLSEPGLLARIMVAGYLRRSGQQNEATALLNEMVRLTEEAIRDYESGKNDEGLGNAYYWRGSARRELGQFDSAVDDLRKAIKYKPGWGKAHLELAYAYLDLGDVKSARTEYQRSGIVDEVFVRKLGSRIKPTS